jgi:hypothetical protein
MTNVQQPVHEQLYVLRRAQDERLNSFVCLHPLAMLVEPERRVESNTKET